MHIIVAILGGIASIFYLIFRLQSTARSIRELDRDTHGLRRRARRAYEALVGSPFKRMSDPRLATAVLMIQVVRTGTLTAGEKAKIVEFLRNPLQVDDPAAFFKKAWRYTKRRGSFSLMATDMVPMLRARLTVDERFQLIGMLRQVAGAYSEESELQSDMIARLQRQMMQTEPPV